jgi:FKBP-type peptidyl-prolyl cis-trans isomerase
MLSSRKAAIGPEKDIKGWQEALKLMPAGSKWQLFVSPGLAYGERGVPRANIPPNAALIFDVELLSVGRPGARPAASNAPRKMTVAPEQVDGAKRLFKQQEKRKQRYNRRKINELKISITLDDDNCGGICGRERGRAATLGARQGPARRAGCHQAGADASSSSG